MPLDEHPRRTRLGRLSVYGAELSVGLVLALGFFAVLLWALQQWFPDSTDLGGFARTPPESRRNVATPLPGGPDEHEGEDIAVLSSVRGEVQDKPASSIAWSVAKLGKRLGSGHAVQSYAKADARVLFDDRNSLELGENTIVVLRRRDRPSPKLARQATVLFMDGFIRARIGGPAGGEPALDILAAGGSVRPAPRAGGGDAEIALKLDQKRSTLAVLDGAAEVRWQDQITAVPAGYMVTYDASHAPGTPTPLPATPAPISPAEGETFRFRGNPPRVVFEWRPAGQESEFGLEVAKDSAFADVVYTGRVREPRLVHGSLDRGRYFWRVAGMRSGIAGRPTAAARFEIVQEQTPPALSVDFPAGVVTEPTLVVRGATDPGCQVFINDVSATTDPAGRFEQALTLHHGYNFFVVQAVDALGNTMFQNHTVVARLASAEETR